MKEYPEPIWNAENMNRKKGTTTFKTCGWCKFASCGRARYDCMLETHCDLMSEYGENRDVKWDTQCRILKMGLLDIKDIVASKRQDIKDNLEQNKNLEEEIRVLLKDKRIPRKKKPALPDTRNADYFKLNNIVRVFHNQKWNRGVVVSGYRSGDGCVSYVLDDYPESAKGWGCGMSVPCVMLEWEYKYFKNNLEEYKDYLKLCDRVYNGERLNLDEYYKAMEES